MQTRKELIADAIARAIAGNDIPKLIEMADGRPCACLGCRDDEPLCVCKMTSLQVRGAVSLAGLRRGKIVRLNGALGGI